MASIIRRGHKADLWTMTDSPPTAMFNGIIGRFTLVHQRRHNRCINVNEHWLWCGHLSVTWHVHRPSRVLCLAEFNITIANDVQLGSVYTYACNVCKQSLSHCHYTNQVQHTSCIVSNCLVLRTSYAGTGSGYCFWQSLCVCLSLRAKSLLTRNWCNLGRICPTVNARSGWKLVIFDLDLMSYVRTCSV